MTRIIVPLIAVAFGMTAVTTTLAQSQQMFIYPNKGQSPEQQSKDKYECHVWAVQQSGYDPTNPPAAPAAATQPQQAPPPQSGGTGGAVLRGAIRGAAVADIVDGDEDKGAALGAVRGARKHRQREKRRQEEYMRAQQQTQQQAQQQAQAQQQQTVGTYQRAQVACLQGRGYTVN